MGDYQPPLDQLLRQPERPSLGKDWPDYLALGFDSRHVPELIRMATDPALNEADSESPEVWAPVHAWRALGQLRAEEAIGPLMEVIAAFSLDSPDDWAFEELPVVIGMIGAAAVPAARAILEDGSSSFSAKLATARTLSEIGQKHPEARDECVRALTARLENAGSSEPDLNGFVVDALIELQATEAAEVIERAFAGGFIDESIVGPWYDVWHALDLEGEPPPEPERRVRVGWDDESGEEDIGSENPFRRFGGPAHEPRPTRQPAVTRTPEERKDRNRVLKKLTKKVKGKKGKKR